MKIKKLFAFAVFLLCFPLFSQSPDVLLQRQNRDFIASSVTKAQGAKSLSLTKDFGLIALYRKNDAAAANVPSQLVEKIQEMNNQNQEIFDINISEDGKWAILGDTIVFSPDCNREMLSAVRDFIEEGEKITCVSFNSTDWCILTQKKFKCSSPEMSDFILRAFEIYGEVQYVFVGPQNTVVTCKSSAVWTQKVSKQFYNALTNSDFTPTIIKYFYDGSYFFANPAEGRSTFSF